MFLLLSLLSCKQKPEVIETNQFDLFHLDNLVAWCVVPFDSKERGPVERAEMLKELGFSKFAYDWRAKHLESFPKEIQALKANGIELASAWFWVDGPEEIIDANNERFLQLLKEHKVKTELWLCLNQKVFDNLTKDESLQKAISVVDIYYKRAQELGCTLALYNHGKWFGEPTNQIAIIKALGYEDIKMVYNFHHAHEQLDDFPALVRQILPHLSTVNLNGMELDGSKILPLGSGDLEEGMLRSLQGAGYEGAIGIIGHIETEDVRDVLSRNLTGLTKLKKKLADSSSN